jgi:hypothetical protein
MHCRFCVRHPAGMTLHFNSRFRDIGHCFRRSLPLLLTPVAPCGHVIRTYLSVKTRTPSIPKTTPLFGVHRPSLTVFLFLPPVNDTASIMMEFLSLIKKGRPLPFAFILCKRLQRLLFRTAIHSLTYDPLPALSTSSSHLLPDLAPFRLLGATQTQRTTR